MCFSTEIFWVSVEIGINEQNYHMEVYENLWVLFYEFIVTILNSTQTKFRSFVFQQIKDNSFYIEIPIQTTFKGYSLIVKR